MGIDRKYSYIEPRIHRLHKFATDICEDTIYVS